MIAQEIKAAVTRDPVAEIGMLGWVLALVCCGLFIWKTDQLAGERRHSAQLALSESNLIAQRDTSRAVALSRADSIRLLGDSILAVTKLAVQERQTSDGLSKALGIEQKATVTLRAQLQALAVTAAPSAAPVVTDSATDVRSASFHIRHEPYTADATARLPRTGAGALDLAVALDPAPIGVHVGCDKANKDGIMPARVLATGPQWLALTIASASQDPGVCPSPALVGGGQRWYIPDFRPHLSAGLGWGFKPWAGVTLISWPRW